MKRIFLCLLSIFIIACQQNPSTNILYSSDFDDIQYFSEDFFLLEGTDIPDSLKYNKYDRLPASYKELVREPVWDLSKNSAGFDIGKKYIDLKIAIKQATKKATKVDSITKII